MARYLETLLRFRLRFLILLLIAPLSLGTSGVLVLRTYEASANLSVSEPAYLGQDVTPADWTARLSPAQNTAAAIRQMVATHAFAEEIAAKLVAPGLQLDSASRSQLGDSLGTGLRVSTEGAHLVRLGFSNPREVVAVAVLRSIIDLYAEHERGAQQARMDVSTTFLSTQVTAAETAATVAQQELTAYLDTHPGLRSVAPGGGAGTAELDRATLKLRLAQNNLSQLLGQLTQARFLGAAQQRLAETNTQVVDQPRVADEGLIGDGRSLLAGYVVSVLCILAAGLYLVALVWADRTARDGKELERRLNVPVLTTIPLASLQERF